MQANAVDVIKAVCGAVIEAVEVAGDHGAPGGVLYAALMGHMSLSTFEGLMAALVKAGKLTKRGQLYFVVK